MNRLTSIEELAPLREKIRSSVDPARVRLVVCGGTGCRAAGSIELAEALARQLGEQDLDAGVELMLSGCHGFCQQGPVVVIEPQGIFYREVGRKNPQRDASDIIEKTIKNGEIVGRLKNEMRAMRMMIVQGESYETIERVEGERPYVRCRLKSGTVLEADVMLYSVGRDGNSSGLGLEEIGITPNERGLISVNKHYQTSRDHIYAVGDIIGFPALASTSMEQGRRAIRHAFDLPGTKRQTEMLPFAIYSIPEVSYVGETEENLRDKGVDYIIGRGLCAFNPRGQIIGDAGGMLKLLFDAQSMRLLGAHMVGTNASELIHIAQAFLQSRGTATAIAETLYNYPTLSDLYRHAAMEALGIRYRRDLAEAKKAEA